MRQRLLLIAGWAVAAVGSGLVASGAVAVAGGQVSDRPLRPLSAAEVAALPVSPVVDNPALASGGTPAGAADQGASDPTEVDGTTGDEGAAANEEPDDPEPLRPVSPTATGTSSSTTTTTIPDRSVTPIIPGGVASEGAIYQLTGGSVAVGGSPELVLLLWATPRAGYVAAYDYLSDTELIVTLTSLGHQSSLRAEWVDGELSISTAEGEAR